MPFQYGARPPPIWLFSFVPDSHQVSGTAIRHRRHLSGSNESLILGHGGRDGTADRHGGLPLPGNASLVSRFPGLTQAAWMDPPAEYITSGIAPRPGSRELSTTDLDFPSVDCLPVRQHGGLEMDMGVHAGARRHASQRPDESGMLELRRGFCQRRPLQHRWRVQPIL